ncbi:hypothetical protein C8D87_103771 [Lentzea atacamensis]|uniref:Uncharacterized protein n=1 Tax=Lentzea atacamensis TaxID=531938 RepID=A0ABX9EB85_9PSEU|nr:hypothetical protein C8D87_103771 [Lentzea atacamensis]
MTVGSFSVPCGVLKSPTSLVRRLRGAKTRSNRLTCASGCCRFVLVDQLRQVSRVTAASLEPGEIGSSDVRRPGRYRRQRDRARPFSAWSHQSVLPQPDRQPPHQCDQHRTISPIQTRTTVSPAQHRDLIPHHQQLHILRRRRPAEQNRPTTQLNKDETEQSQSHAHDHAAGTPEPDHCSSASAEFWHPTGQLPTKHGVLVPQHKQLRILLRFTTEQHLCGGQHLPSHLVQQRHDHPSMLPAWKRCAATLR